MAQEAAFDIHEVTTPAEAELVAELAALIWREHYEPIIGAAQVDYMLNAFQSPDRIWLDIVNQGICYEWLARSGEAVAYMASRFDERGCFLSKLYVHKTQRGQGCARLMLDRLIQRCRTQTVSRIWLTVNKHNSGSIAAYKKMGFWVIDEIVTDIGSGYVMDDYVMALDIC
jgi:ribosomal protein S18 acetylase RimI-like enzyme